VVIVRHGTGEITALFRERHTFTPGTQVRLKPRPELAHLFDRASGRRI